MKISILFNVLFLALLKLVVSDTCISDSACTSDCLNVGYITDSSSGACRDPNESECLQDNSANCTGDKTRCLAYGYTTISSSGDCHKPTDDECANNSVGDGNLCASTNYVCQIRGFAKSDSSNQCISVDDCSTTGNCQLPLTKCYVPDSNGDCTTPTLDYCNKNSNSYACYSATGFCVTNGWLQGVQNNDYSCYAPSQSYCTTTSGSCSQNSDACAYAYGYIQDTDSQMCKKPGPLDCKNSLFPYTCANSSSFCSIQGWVKNSTDSSCIIDTDCLNKDKCQQTQTACLFNGYVLNSDGNACVTPTQSDCNNKQNKYVCALPTNTCVNSFGWVIETNSFTCNPPTQQSCQGSQNCVNNEHACVYYYGFINNSNNICDQPQPSDCLNQNNIYACSNLSTFCMQQNFKQNGSSNTCTLPSTCLTGSNMCATGYISCLYQGYVKSATTDDCVTPLSSDCEKQSNTYACAQSTSICVQQYGWIKDQSAAFCTPPTSVQCKGTNNCSQSESACVWLYGYINNSSGVCDIPQPSDCVVNSNLYACRDSSFFCRQQNFQPDNSNSSCTLPTTCLTDQNMCASGYTSCLYIGYVKSTTNDNCVTPLSSDCEKQTNIYACALATNICVQQYGWLNQNSSYCTPPTSAQCQGTNNCSQSESACVWLYGYVNNSSGVCDIPQPSDCANNSNLYACKDSNFFCRQQNFQPNDSNSACALPTTCLSGQNMCASGYSSCLYIGYIKSATDDNCVIPTSSDCEKQVNMYACARPTNICVQQYGWISQNASYCTPPTSDQCQGTNNCSQSESACVWLYGYINNSSGVCDVPQPSDCANSSNLYACRNSNFYCRQQNFQPNTQNSACSLPTTCLTSQNMCASGYTSCLYIGYVKSATTDDCVTPLSSDCEKQSNTYACAQSTNICVQQYGWIKDQSATFCTPPTSDQCKGTNNCSQSESACVWLYGYINNSSGVCDIPQPSDCANSSNLYACRDSSFFCRQQNFQVNSSNSSCTLPTTCLTDQNMCASGYTSCLYIGYVKSTTSDNCVTPLSQDCEKQTNIYACALTTNICVQQYGWLNQNSSYCTPPTSAQCQGTNNCSQSESACVWLYGYVNNSSGVCDIPQPSDCQNSSNLYACRNSNFFCRQQNFQPNNSDSSCTPPSTCLTDQNMCASGLTSCLELGYVKSSTSDNCVTPLSSDCANQSNLYACAQATNICVQQYGWIKDQTASFCTPPTSAQCQGTNSCSQSESACAWLYGYINNASGVCDIPQPSDCANSSNLYTCRDSSFFCRQQNFQVNNSNSSCALPTTCLTDQNMCASGYTSCLYIGYIKSSTNDNCVTPLSSDCENQSNLYACALTTNICVQKYGWIQDQSASFCTPPSSAQCQGTNNCSQSESACVWLYGYINNSSGVCDIPKPSDCAESSNIYACRDSHFFCRKQNFQQNNSNSSCAFPTTCLTDQNMCASDYTSCLYIGYVKSSTSDNCVTPLSSDCAKQSNLYACALTTNICVQQYGWLNQNSSYCTPPTSAQCQGTNNCSQSESACVWLFGYVNNSSAVCDIPSPSDCVNSMNNSNSSCALPTTCLTDQNMCASGYTSCIYQGYVKSTANDNCVAPLSSDCEKQSNIYACALSTNICVQQYGWLNQNSSFCTPPTSAQCQGTNNCSQSESACVWLYGYINNSNSVCDIPSPSDCVNSSNLYACRNSNFFCRQQNFQSNNSNSTCDLPTTCLTDQNMCASGYTSCLYLGYVKNATSDNCVAPLSSDCEKQSNLYACARSTNICVQQYGWINQNSSYCTPPTSAQCQGTNNCSQSESACVWLYGYINNSSSVCDTPAPSDCINSNNLYVCRASNFFCRLQNFEQNSPNYTCKLPTTCLSASDKCTPGYTSCTYQGFVKSTTSNQCIEPLSSDCSDQTNIYACAMSSNTCVNKYGWIKDSTFSYCVAPTSSSCFDTSNCNYNESACVWLYGYINNTNGKCDIPQPSDCVNTSNIYTCRLDGFFCRQQNFLLSSGGSCTLPTTCLTDPGLCTPGYNSCTYQGYVKDTSSNNCVNPLSSDCSKQSNAYACALSTNMCVAQYGWVKDTTQQFCNPPSIASCTGSSHCTSNESACVWYYGFVIKSSNICSQPYPADCLNTQNIYACRDQTTLCGQQNFLKNQSNETCTLPTTCLTDLNMCAAAYTSCTYQGYVKTSSNDNCQQPTSYDCQQQTNLYACALLTNYCVQQFGWVKNSNSNNYYCDPPTLSACQGSSQCLNDGNACSFLYGLVNSNNICSIPNSYQCQHLAGIYGCRLATHYCRQINFQQDTPNDSCKVPSNCGQVGAGLCSPSYQSCTVQGFVKSQNSNDCIVPSQSDCLNQANTLACAQSTNQCILYGWQKDANNFYCVPPSSSTCQQSPSCSSNETACVYQYGFNYDQNGNCLAPSTTDCLDSTKIYSCNSATSYCRQLYFKKSNSNGSCVLPTDCSTNSSACSSQYTACLYQGYVKNSSNNSCKIPTTQDCSNTSNIYACAQTTNFCNVYGWIVASTSNLYCIPILQAQCTNTGLNYCQYQQSSCQYLYGYVKSQSSNDCVIPTPFDCVNTNNIYACQNSNSFCQKQGWPKNINANKYTCSIPSNCLNSSYCNSGQTACPYLGFVSSTTNPGTCITPTDSDCLLQSNQYACAQSSNTCMLMGYIQTTATNQYYCTAPTLTNCQSNNSCQQGLTACQYVYGLVNDFTTNQCIQPTDSDCSNQTNIFACRLSTFACRQQNWLAVSSTNFSCVVPSNCLSGNQCQSGYTACQYYGYIKSSSGNNCVVPSDSDCFNTSNTYLCRSDITFCTSRGWIIQTSVQNSFYCVAPSYCLNQPYCGNGLTACQYIGYLSSTNNICVVPGDYDCADTVNNPFLCRADITFCTSKGYIKSSTNNSCNLPTSCTGVNDCAPGKSACQFTFGLIKNSSSNTCVAPDINTCNDNTQLYACKVGNTYCTNLGFFKSQVNDTCVLPTDCTINNQCASGLVVCLYYFGYIQSTTSNQCVQPTVVDCLNSANLYVCRTGNPFCTQLGYVLNSSTAGQCQVPSNCLSGQQCGSNQASQACLYNGYIPTSSTNFQCMIPQYDDCKNPQNTQLCRTGIYQQNCLNIGFVKSSSGNNCVFPASCTTGFQCGTTKIVCYKLGYVKSISNNKCVTPSNYDCSNTTLNKYQCSSDSLISLCQSFGWVKDTVNDYCVPPSTCAVGSDCGPSMSVCQFVYGYAPDSTTNKCIIPSDSDCMNSNNLYLCKSGNQYCVSIGYQKSSSNDTCTSPSNCLVGPNCSYGLTACQYTQGLIKNYSDNTCIVPTEADCDDQNKNLFACRLPSFVCSQKGWQLTTQPNQYSCAYNNQQDCINLSNQCSSTITACQYKFGYVQGTSNQCIVPEDSDCMNTSNIFACVPNSFCILKGWIATGPNNFTCQSPNCLKGEWCSVQFTACTSQGFVKSQVDDSCQYPQDYDCAASSSTGLQLCSATSTFCTGRGWVKNPNNNTCLPPANCLTGYQCAPNLTACKYQGYVTSATDYSCTTPTDADCLDNTQSLCRPGLPVNICGQKGYVQVKNKITDYFCVLPNCLDQQNPQCGANLTACLYGGYLKSPTDDTCISPTDDQCINQNNLYLCRKGNIPCPSRGWIRDISVPTNNLCTVPNNCLSQRGMCASNITACILLGYIKSDSSDSCIAPTDEQCLDQTKQLCSYQESPCSQKGYVQVQNQKTCQYPTNCLGQKMCAPYITACTLQGFISDQSNPTTCKIPTAIDCYDPTQNNCDPAITTKYCINMGFVKSNQGLFCEFPTNCLTGKQCAKEFVACQLQGYIQDPTKNDGVCVQTTIDSCLNSSNSGMCVATSLCVTQFGLIPKSSLDLSCTTPTYQNCYNENICYGKDSYCISNYGFIQDSNQSSSCKVPKCQEIQSQCPTLCIQLGFVTNSNQICSYPTQCDSVGKGYCAANMIACTQQGFSKSSISDDCVCFLTIDSTGKCIQDKQNASTNNTTNKQKLSLNILIMVIILIFFM
ncbi:chitin recognition protein (macronuclear) [Tetrahymena thermophila SB210]|uniref:Chitin recognition protein n=1 Tax=Tetrahymena thermophila (strain SB210) TaxID=312017 RepID=Q22U51_TETTS|nr:chitin recognition protein [Tetrahymena thermophila SB210]EAR88836.2 chitin recognition protein [Tetrahymena thermophila SB210]|eukprot:XP_001009081.2 chitin recognition protein [Tetrahymena thermophila SB210]